MATSSRRRSPRGRHVLARGAALIALGALTLGMPGVAQAADDALEPDGKTSVNTVLPIDIPGLPDLPLPQLPVEPGQAEPDGPPVTEDDDNVGHETENPSDPAHASAEALDATLAGTEVAGVGATDATIEDDNSTHSSATLLALGGQTIIGAEADSQGQEEASEGDPLAPVCAGSEGALCATLIAADASASEDGPGSRSAASTSVADACVGGDDATGASCSGPVEATALASDSTAHRSADGHTTTSSSSQVAGLCLQEDPVTGTCAIGVNLLSSSGHADSASGETSRDSQVAGLQLAGNQAVSITDPYGLTAPPDCASPTLFCLYLNQGETYGAAGLVGTAQEALHVTLLDGNIDALVAQSETWAYQGPADRPDRPDDNGPGDGPRDNAGAEKQHGPQGGTIAGDVLPNTGGVWSGLLGLALGGIGFGALLMAWSRRAIAA